jgi:uncharacterized protein with GYD domain
MPYYMLQASYSPESWSAMTHSPEDRIEAVRPALERLGGKVISGYMSFGQYDIVLIVEMPDSVSAAAFSMASAGTGAIRSHQTTPLLSMDEAKQAMMKSVGSGYSPPGLFEPHE